MLLQALGHVEGLLRNGGSCRGVAVHVCYLDSSAVRRLRRVIADCANSGLEVVALRLSAVGRPTCLAVSMLIAHQRVDLHIVRVARDAVRRGPRKTRVLVV